jgi:hypothetical protein
MTFARFWSHNREMAQAALAATHDSHAAAPMGTSPAMTKTPICVDVALGVSASHAGQRARQLKTKVIDECEHLTFLA